MAKVAALFSRCILLVALLVSVEMVRSSAILGEEKRKRSSLCIYGIFCYNKPNQPPQRCIAACHFKFGPSAPVSCRLCGGSPLPICYCG